MLDIVLAVVAILLISPLQAPLFSAMYLCCGMYMNNFSLPSL